MKQLLEYIIPNIVNHPEDVKIDEANQDGLITVTIQTHPEDIGRVIGKSGKVIKAIRQIARIIAIKQGVRVNIDVLDTAERSSTPRNDQEAESNPESEPKPELNNTESSQDNPLPEAEGIDLQTE